MLQRTIKVQYLKYHTVLFFRYVSELTTKIESRKMQLNQLETQRTDIKNAVTKEAKSLERQKLAHLRRLEEVTLNLF